MNTLNSTKKLNYSYFLSNSKICKNRSFSERMNEVQRDKINLTLQLVTNSKYTDSVGGLFLKAKRFILAGGKVVQVRFKEEESREHVELAKLLATNMPMWDPESLLIINDRPDVALVAGAQGVHLGPTDMSPKDARKLLGDNSIIGYTVNSLEDVLFANSNDCIDYIGVQVFPSKSSRVHSPKVWGDELADVMAISMKPVVLIGGLTQKNLPEVLPFLRSKDGVAIGGEILKEDDPWDTTRKIQALVNEHLEKTKNRY